MYALERARSFINEGSPVAAGSPDPAATYTRLVLRLLVLDDESITGLGIAELLRGAGFSIVASVQTTSAAIAACRTDRPDVVVSDVMLDGRPSGLELPRLLADEGLDAIRVIYLSSYVATYFVGRAREAGAAGYLLKSMPLKGLVGAIRGRSLRPVQFPGASAHRAASLGRGAHAHHLAGRGLHERGSGRAYQAHGEGGGDALGQTVRALRCPGPDPPRSGRAPASGAVNAADVASASASPLAATTPLFLAWRGAGWSRCGYKCLDTQRITVRSASPRTCRWHRVQRLGPARQPPTAKPAGRIRRRARTWGADR